jgi:predicted ATPase
MRRVVHDDGQEAFLQPRVMQALVALVRADGRVLSRGDLMAQCWSGMVVGDDALNRVISRLRRLSETLASGVLRLETITKVGYRLVRARGNLPRRLTPLLGRDAELQWISAQLQSADIVTITGAGGVGKTRLAHQVGQALLEAFEDGVWLVELAPVTDPALVAGAVARAMGLDLPAEDEPLGALVERLKPRDCLIILDNCEHLIDAAAALVAALLERSSTVKLLATSQDALRAEGEQVFSLQPLAASDAAQLFCERARAVDASFDPSERNAEAVADICQRLDGIPLAIEMAAVQAPALGCDGLLVRLDDRFRLLTGGRRTALPRHRTLIATLDWSYDLLPEREAAVFRRLGVFGGGFSLDAATAVCACERWDGVEVAKALADLVRKSLVAPETARGGDQRYHLLETMRAYALEKLAAAGEARTLHQAHADCFHRLAAESLGDYYLKPVSDHAFVERYFGEVDNFARAIDWAFGPDGDAQAGIALVADMVALVWARSLFAEFAAWTEQAVARLNPETPPAVRARLLAGQARIYTGWRTAWRGPVGISRARADALAMPAIEACRADGDALSLFMALWALGWAESDLRRAEDSAPVRAEMLALADRLPGQTRSGAAVKYWLWREAFTLEPATTTPNLLDEAIADLRSFGAEAQAILYRSRRLFDYAPTDTGAAIDAWRTLLADAQRTYTNAGATTSVVVGQLMTHLARRGGARDLDEAIELGRHHAHVDVWFEGFHTTAGLAWVALRTGRAPLAAHLAGRIDRVATGFSSGSQERRLADSLLSALRVELAEAELGAAMGQGAGLGAEDARRLVLGA